MTPTLLWGGSCLVLAIAAGPLGCGDSANSFPAAEALPLPPGLEVAASKSTPGAAGPEYINYLVVTSSESASPRTLTRRLKHHLRAEGWAMGRLPDTRFHRGDWTAESEDVFAVFSRSPCDDKPATAAPPATAEAAVDLRRDGRASICVSLA